MHTGPISYPNWKQTLAKSDLNQDRQTVFSREIISFLRHCNAGKNAGKKQGQA